MQLISIDYKKQQKKILVTYSSLSDKFITIDGDVTLMMINLVNFSEKYLKLEMPVSIYFKIELEQKQYVDFQNFKQVLSECISNPQKCFEINSDSIQNILKHLQFMEEDMNKRIIFISQLPQEIDNTNTLSAENLKLVNNIKQNEEYVDEKIKFQDPQDQLLYIVQSTLRQQKDNEQIVIIKLGKTIKSIEEYVKVLKKTYYNKIEFTPLFARRLYCPGKTLIDTKPFHSKLIKQIPQTKVYIKAPPNEKGNNYFVEFYQLTQQFVETFKELLKQFIDENKESYDSRVNNSELQYILQPDLNNQSSSDESINDVDFNINFDEDIDIDININSKNSEDHDNLELINMLNQNDKQQQHVQDIMDNSDHLQSQNILENISPKPEESCYLNNSQDLKRVDHQFCEKQDGEKQNEMTITKKGIQIVESILSKLDIKSGFLKKLFLLNQSKREKEAQQN